MQGDNFRILENWRNGRIAEKNMQLVGISSTIVLSYLSIFLSKLFRYLNNVFKKCLLRMINGNYFLLDEFSFIFIS